jgi:hypothetical protein
MISGPPERIHLVRFRKRPLKEQSSRRFVDHRGRADCTFDPSPTTESCCKDIAETTDIGVDSENASGSILAAEDVGVWVAKTGTRFGRKYMQVIQRWPAPRSFGRSPFQWRR